MNLHKINKVAFAQQVRTVLVVLHKFARLVIINQIKVNLLAYIAQLVFYAMKKNFKHPKNVV